jgi:hypothetical protein
MTTTGDNTAVLDPILTEQEHHEALRQMLGMMQAIGAGAPADRPALVTRLAALAQIVEEYELSREPPQVSMLTDAAAGLVLACACSVPASRMPGGRQP